MLSVPLRHVRLFSSSLLAVTLLSSEPEVQYVALRNINLIVQKRADILAAHMKVFFVKYNDPIYVKLEKLDVLIRLATDSNIHQVRICVCVRVCVCACMRVCVCVCVCVCLACSLV
jgi:vesicle coat complex subunit